jgi:hypothetical protein
MSGRSYDRHAVLGSANNNMQRSRMYKVQGRGRSLPVLVQVLLARVLKGQWPLADVGR